MNDKEERRREREEEEGRSGETLASMSPFESIGI